MGKRSWQIKEALPSDSAEDVRRLQEQLLSHGLQEQLSPASAKTKRRLHLAMTKKEPTASKYSAIIEENETFDAIQALRKSKDLNCPIDTTKDARSLFDQYAKWDVRRNYLDFKMFGEVVKHILKSTGQTLSEDGMKKKIEVCWSEADRNFNGKVDFDEFAIWYSSWGFQRELLLSPQQILFRDLAKENNLNIVDVDALQAKFHQIDEDGSGVIEFCEFKKLLCKLMKVPRGQELPESRLMHFWKEIDIDGSGTVNFDEFLQWYVKYFDMKGNSDCCPSEQLYQSVRPNLGRPI